MSINVAPVGKVALSFHFEPSWQSIEEVMSWPQPREEQFQEQVHGLQFQVNGDLFCKVTRNAVFCIMFVYLYFDVLFKNKCLQSPMVHWTNGGPQ
jgi:hypothetical protein